MANSDQITSRHNQIMDYLNIRKYASINNLCDICRVSSSTIRRDIASLEEKELVSSVHDGVILNKFENPNPFKLERIIDQFKEKQSIGEAAASLINNNETVFIAGGSTTEYMIPFMSEKKGITVITNALNIAAKLVTFPHIKTIILGGELENEFNLMGHLTEDGMNSIISQKLFRSVTGIHPTYGLTTDAPIIVNVDKAMIEKLGELIILADHTKFTRLGPVPLAPISAISILITDSQTPKAALDIIKNSGVRVIQID